MPRNGHITPAQAARLLGAELRPTLRPDRRQAASSQHQLIAALRNLERTLNQGADAAAVVVYHLEHTDARINVAS